MSPVWRLAGSPSEKLLERAARTGVEGFTNEANPVVFWDLLGKLGHPVRTTVSEMGPNLLSRILELNDTQSGVLEIAFQFADEQGLLLLDLDDLRTLLAFVADNRKEISTRYGLVSSPSIGAIQRALLSLEREGGKSFFGEPALDLADLLHIDSQRPGRHQYSGGERVDLEATAVFDFSALAVVGVVREPARSR